ncbi:surf-like protein [Vermiconidia calcicola]|uniref:Surf-like protein n=1 Tax=Vermiconidia calcicola TaxID=1690605 RepID=A0ACC3MSF8_9PEZI|nr:surf-like protein [Vermiconidia calcicola]
MNNSTQLLHLFRSNATRSAPSQWVCAQCLRTAKPTKPSNILRQQRRYQSTQNPADSPDFKSILDKPVQLVRSGRRHKPLGLIILAAIPVTAFFLGCWQVRRLGLKTELIARFEDRLVRDPLPLPPQIDPDAIKEFDYRRVTTRGKWRHEQEMLIGPRVHDGNDGFLVITPLDRSAEVPGFKGNTTILVCRGWIPKSKADKNLRLDGLPTGTVEVEGLLREPWKKNMFTPDNRPAQGMWHFPDIYQMAEHVGSQPVWIEETMKPNLLESYRREEAGIPIGRPPEVNLRNNHVQYIFTWFSLSAATGIMLWMVVKRPRGGGGIGGIAGRRVRESREW